MERGLYAVASAMTAQQTIQETIAQNIANANTTAYKQDVPTFKALHGMMLQRSLDGAGSGPQIGEIGMGVAPDVIATNWTNGAIVATTNPMDASLDSGQFFTVRTPEGDRYTRAGNFQRDGSGKLLTQQGYEVLSSNGTPIVAPGDAHFSANGNVMIGNQVIAQLKIVQPDLTQLSKQGNNLYISTSSAPAPAATAPSLHPGTLEASNVNTVQSMVQMLSIGRGFDMAQRALTTQDDLLRQANSELSKT